MYSYCVRLDLLKRHDCCLIYNLYNKDYKLWPCDSGVKGERGLACRVYRINPNFISEVKHLFKNNNEKICYNTYKKGTNEKVDLTFSIRSVSENDYGYLYSIYLDKIMFLPDKDKEKLVVYTPTFKLQIFENTKQFQNHLVVYGPKTIDAGIKVAIEKQLAKTSTQVIEDPIVLLKIDFEKIQSLTEEFPNVQHFCIKDINDDRLQDVIIKGDMLEKTAQYNEFVLQENTKGAVNFLGITMDDRLFYVGKDGSIHSRSSFNQSEMIKLIYVLINKVLSRDAFFKSLDDYN